MDKEPHQSWFKWAEKEVPYIEYLTEGRWRRYWGRTGSSGADTVFVNDLWRELNNKGLQWSIEKTQNSIEWLLSKAADEQVSAVFVGVRESSSNLTDRRGGSWAPDHHAGMTS